MGWSESYYRDYREQTRLAWERRARRLLEELDLFASRVGEDAGLLGLDSAAYRDLLGRLRDRIQEDLPALRGLNNAGERY